MASGFVRSGGVHAWVASLRGMARTCPCGGVLAGFGICLLAMSPRLVVEFEAWRGLSMRQGVGWLRDLSARDESMLGCWLSRHGADCPCGGVLVGFGICLLAVSPRLVVEPSGHGADCP